MQSGIPASGSLVWIRRQRWRIHRARRDREVLRLDVTRGPHGVTFLAPFDRPAFADRRARPIRARPRQACARLACAAGRTRAFDTPVCARRARLHLLPHQLEPALAVLSGARRILLADEVGLGKTIQAGLILAELHARRPGCRSLILVPASLIDQWRDELRDRFALDPRIADSDGLGACARADGFGASPWSRAGLWLASADFIKQPHVADALPLAPWDVVIVDEAHGVTGASDRHEACAEACRRARHVVLLTATPHTGDEARFARLLGLGALPEIGDRLLVFRRSRRDLPDSGGRRRVVRWHRVGPSRDGARLLDALLAFDAAVLGRAHPPSNALLLLSIFRKRALSTFAALDLSLARRQAWLDATVPVESPDWLQQRLILDDADAVTEEERTALTGESGLAAAHERTRLSRLRLLARAAMPHDRKVARLAQLVARTDEPVVIFTEFRDSLEHVQRRLQAIRVVSALHGGQPAAERRDALARFLRGESSVLIATDVGGQGLNLQSRARWVVTLELPWNPARLEQRIGRVDRIGQTRRAHATVLLTRHPAEHPILLRLAHRAVASQHAMADPPSPDRWPPEAAVRAVVIGGDDLRDVRPRDPPLSSYAAFTRRARAVARVLTKQRVWLRQWRAPAEVAARPRWASVPMIAGPTRAGAIVVVTVPILDGSGAEVERHLVTMALSPEVAARRASPAAMAAIERVACGRLASRIRRVHRATSEAIRRSTAIDEAIARHLRTLRPPGVQPGLFDRRDADRFERARTEMGRVAADHHCDLAAQRDRLHLTVGRPRLDVWLLRR
jgi:superfamily II DNA or RNA helicase